MRFLRDERGIGESYCFWSNSTGRVLCEGRIARCSKGLDRDYVLTRLTVDVESVLDGRAPGWRERGGERKVGGILKSCINSGPIQMDESLRSLGEVINEHQPCDRVFKELQPVFGELTMYLWRNP